jgi:regulator of sigma E protease
MLFAVIAIILTLILVVGIHEAGHAIAAYFFDVKIEKISIGFGKPLLHWRSKGGIQWVWGIWPLGGYVQLLNSRITPVKPEEYPACFDKKPVWIRIIILLAGAFANLITAWIAFVLVLYIGINLKPPQIQSVQPTSISAQAGLMPGDVFLEISDHHISSWQDVGLQLVILWGKKDIKIKVSSINGTAMREMSLDLSKVKFAGKEKSLLSAIGIIPNLTVAPGSAGPSSFSELLVQASHTIVYMIYFFMMILKQLITGTIPFSILLGPIGIFATSIATLTEGSGVFLSFIANFSLAVAVVNLFPLPGLDGGSVLYCIIEKIRGKSISVAFEVLLYQLMFIIFCLLLVQLINNDLVRYFSH